MLHVANNAPVKAPTIAAVALPYALESLFEDEVMEAQNAWANAITSISAAYLSGGDYVKTATDAAGELYGYGKMSAL